MGLLKNILGRKKQEKQDISSLILHFRKEAFPICQEYRDTADFIDFRQEEINIGTCAAALVSSAHFVNTSNLMLGSGHSIKKAAEAWKVASKIEKINTDFFNEASLIIKHACDKAENIKTDINKWDDIFIPLARKRDREYRQPIDRVSIPVVTMNLMNTKNSSVEDDLDDMENKNKVLLDVIKKDLGKSLNPLDDLKLRVGIFELICKIVPI